MEPIWNWGNNVIVSIQATRNPAFDSLFNIITFLGEAEFFLLLFPLVIWSFNKSIGLRLAYIVLISVVLNAWVKFIFNHPRPFEWPSEAISPVLKLNDRAQGPGLPSGHTQLSLVIWFYLAYHLQRTWSWLIAALLFVFISFSRVYLGVHFPTDLLGGVILGLATLLLFLKFEPQLTAIFLKQALWFQIGLLIIVPLGLILISSSSDEVTALAVLSGFNLGILVDRATINFQATGSVIQRIVRYVLGVILLAIFFLGLDVIEPAPGNIFHTLFDVTQLAFSGFWVSAGAPWLFKRINLA